MLPATLTRLSATSSRAKGAAKVPQHARFSIDYLGGIAIIHRGASQWAGALGEHGRRAILNAAELIDEALRLAMPRAKPSIVGTYEIQAGIIARTSCRKAAAMTMHLSAMNRIDPAAEPRLGVIAGHNVAVTAADLGQLDIAMYGLLRLQGQYELVAESKASLMREHLAAGIAWKQGQLSEADHRLHTLRERFAERQMFLEAASVDLSSAGLAADGGRWLIAERLVARAARALFAAGSPFAAHAVSRLLRQGGLRQLDPW